MTEPTGTPNPFGKWTLIGAGVLILIAIGAFAAGSQMLWSAYMSSPGVSVQRLSEAIRAGDWDGFVRYVDVESVVHRSLSASPSRPATRDASGTTVTDATRLRAVETTVTREVNSSAKASLNPSARVRVKGPSVFDTPVTAADVRSVVHDGEEASVTVSVPSAKGRFDVVLRMKPAGDHWRVVGFDGDLHRLIGQ